LTIVLFNTTLRLYTWGSNSIITVLAMIYCRSANIFSFHVEHKKLTTSPSFSRFSKSDVDLQGILLATHCVFYFWHGNRTILLAYSILKSIVSSFRTRFLIVVPLQCFATYPRPFYRPLEPVTCFPTSSCKRSVYDFSFILHGECHVVSRTLSKVQAQCDYTDSTVMLFLFQKRVFTIPLQ
jgi:hypothetical protein